MNWWWITLTQGVVSVLVFLVWWLIKLGERE